MTLKTEAAFYYGFEVTSECNWIDFKEGEFGSVLSVELPVGHYCSEELRSIIEIALNGAGLLNYTVTFDRFTRKITIHAGDYFELLIGSGPNTQGSILRCLGFSDYHTYGDGHDYGEAGPVYGDEDTGLFPFHRSKNGAGFSYIPQFCIQDYRDADNNCALRSPSINESTNGECIEVISFGEDNFYDFNFKYITDLHMQPDAPIRNNKDAVKEVNAFMKWAIHRKVIEFIPDYRNPNIFYKIRLEKARGGKKGTGYSLKELYSKGMPDFYETGTLTFRRLS